MARPGPKDELTIAALAGGLSARAAAAAVGLSERTVRRKLAVPEFAKRVRDAKAAVVAEAVARLGGLMGPAIDRLAMLIDRGADPVALGACRTVIDMALKGRGQEELERQLAGLLDRVEKLTAAKGAK